MQSARVSQREFRLYTKSADVQPAVYLWTGEREIWLDRFVYKPGVAYQLSDPHQRIQPKVFRVLGYFLPEANDPDLSGSDPQIDLRVRNLNPFTLRAGETKTYQFPQCVADNGVLAPRSWTIRVIDLPEAVQQIDSVERLPVLSDVTESIQTASDVPRFGNRAAKQASQSSQSNLSSIESFPSVPIRKNDAVRIQAILERWVEISKLIEAEPVWTTGMAQNRFWVQHESGDVLFQLRFAIDGYTLGSPQPPMVLQEWLKAIMLKASDTLSERDYWQQKNYAQDLFGRLIVAPTDSIEQFLNYLFLLKPSPKRAKKSS